MSYTPKQSYRDAAKIEEIINQVLQEYDIEDKDNQPGYYTLIRTLHTTLSIMGSKVGLQLTVSRMSTVVPE